MHRQRSAVNTPPAEWREGFHHFLPPPPNASIMEIDQQSIDDLNATVAAMAQQAATMAQQAATASAIIARQAATISMLTKRLQNLEAGVQPSTQQPAIEGDDLVSSRARSARVESIQPGDAKMGGSQSGFEAAPESPSSKAYDAKEEGKFDRSTLSEDELEAEIIKELHGVFSGAYKSSDIEGTTPFHSNQSPSTRSNIFETDSGQFVPRPSQPFECPQPIEGGRPLDAATNPPVPPRGNHRSSTGRGRNNTRSVSEPC